MHSIDVCFFASLREDIGMEKMTLELSELTSIKDIKTLIVNQLDNSQSLLAQGIQASIDFEFARDNSIVNPEVVKEIAFFPPVTGG